MNKNLALQSQEFVLGVEDKTWVISFYYNFKRGTGGLCGEGWKKFVRDNSLEEFDVLLFKLPNPNNATIVFDVEIFRVVPKILPPLLVNSSILA